MNIVIRADASIDIGSGHVMRCLTLADDLKNKGGIVNFVCRDFPGQLSKLIKSRGYKTILLPEPVQDYISKIDDPTHADWLNVAWDVDARETIQAIAEDVIDLVIVDHYGIDFRWHKKLRSSAKSIMVIDDLADRRLDCDFLLDQTLGRNTDTYKLLVNKKTHLLLGTEYALLRQEFAQLRDKAIEKRKSFNFIKRIMISIGGMDSEDVTGRVLESLALFNWISKPTIDVVMGGQSPNLNKIIEQSEKHPLSVNVHVDVDNMAEFMLAADIGIGSAGSTSWERCTLALPSLVIVLADNQKVIASMLEKAGAVILWKNVEDLHTIFKKISENNRMLMDMHDASSKICDGLGCSRVTTELSKYVVN